MSSVTATALCAMNAASLRFGQAAGRIAAASPVDISRDVVDLLTAKRDFEANLLVLRVEHEMMERLLDIRA